MRKIKNFSEGEPTLEALFKKAGRYEIQRFFARKNKRYNGKQQFFNP